MTDWVKDKPKIEYDGEKGIYQPNEIEEVLIRIKRVLVKNGISLHPANEQDTAGFEKKHSITLPLAYRRFIIEVTDGIDEGYHCSIPKLIGRKISGSPGIPFPLKNYWAAESEEELCEEIFNRGLHEVNNNGRIDLDYNQGLWTLIVTGDCYGEVWNVGNWNTYHFTSLLFPRRDFLSWFEFCLENKIDINNGNEVFIAMNGFHKDLWDWDKYSDFDRS